MRTVVDHLSDRHENRRSALDELKLIQGVSSAQEWIDVADWMGMTIATEVEHLLMGAAPALEALPPDGEAKSILHRARALGDDLTRMTETRSVEERTAVSPRKLISDAVRLLLGDDPDPTNPIHVDIDPDIETIDVDAGSFRQALLCLLRNAKKVSPEGEPIRIRVRRNAATFVTLEVIDQGAGMNASTMQTATTPFFSGFEPPSSGLGLSFAQSVAELHGGKLAFLDNEPHGLIAQIWIREGAA